MRERLFARSGSAKPSEIQAAGDGVTFTIFDAIGDFGVGATAFSRALADASPRPLTVQINSPGGDAFDGIAMYNLLLNYAGPTRVEILGIAASAASIIAMGADRILIGQGAFVMIHRSAGLTYGTTVEHAEMADVLAQLDDAMARTYASRTGRSADDMLEAMNEETWLVDTDAIEAGLADELLPASSEASALARFDLSSYRRVPAGLSHPRERGEVRSRADIERALLAAGMHGRAAKLCSKAAHEALVGAPSRELENLMSQIALATAELQHKES